MNILDVVAHARAALALRETRAIAEMTRLYHEVIVAIEREAAPILRAIATTQAAGETVPASWLFERDRLAVLERGAITQLERITGRTYAEIMALRANAAQHGASFAIDLLDAATGAAEQGIVTSWAHLNAEAIQSLAATTAADGSPLKALLDELPGFGGQQVRDALLRGVTLGQSPRLIAAEMSRATGMTLTRALTIARTEAMRVYRMAALQSYKANSNSVSGWQWISARSSRTCSFCFAMDGSIHGFDEQLASHPNCRCAMSPITRSWEEILGPRGRGLWQPDPPEPGADVFARQEDAFQMTVLGPAKKRAYDAGAITLRDLIGQRDDPRWGPVGFERGLADVLGAKGAARFMRG